MNSILATIGEAKGIDAATMDSFLATVGEGKILRGSHIIRALR
jgi:hypothetical protein